MGLSLKEAQKLLDLKRQDKSIIFHGDYKGDKEKHTFKCIQCNQMFGSTPNSLKRKNNTGCPYCHVKKLKAQENIKIPKVAEPINRLVSVPNLSTHELNHEFKSLDDLAEIESAILDLEVQISAKSKKIANLRSEHESCVIELVILTDKRDRLGFGLSLLLLPVWLIFHAIYHINSAPYRARMSSLLITIRQAESEMRNLNSKLKELNLSKSKIEESRQYELNILRLQNRLDIRFGGDTNLYYFSFIYEGVKYYKIGITTRSIHDRYRNRDGSQYKLIEQVFFDSKVQEARSIEGIILQAYKEKLAMNRKLLSRKGGYSEVFTVDVLKLDE
jgi:DNA-directed RNA polymerase subunit RPC12/RpoP